MRGVDPVRLANAKLQPDASSTALKLMDSVLSTEEMVNSNPSGVTRSKDETRQRTIRPLDGANMRYIDGMFTVFKPTFSRCSSRKVGFDHLRQNYQEEDDTEVYGLYF